MSTKTTDNKPVKKEDKNKKPNIFVRIGKWFGKTFSGMWAELKKVTWPTFPTVVKQTGVVLAVVLFFMVIVTAFNLGLSELLKLINVNFQ